MPLILEVMFWSGSREGKHGHRKRLFSTSIAECKKSSPNLLRINNTSAVAYKGDSLKRTGQSDKGSVDVVARKEHIHRSSAPRTHRCRVMITDRLEAVSTIFNKNSKNYATRLPAQCPHYFSWQQDPS